MYNLSGGILIDLAENLLAAGEIMGKIVCVLHRKLCSVLCAKGIVKIKDPCRLATGMVRDDDAKNRTVTQIFIGPLHVSGITNLAVLELSGE